MTEACMVKTLTAESYTFTANKSSCYWSECSLPLPTKTWNNFVIEIFNLFSYRRHLVATKCYEI